MDIICAHCREAWDISGLRHDGYEYIDDTQASQLKIGGYYALALAGDGEHRQLVSQRVYMAVMKGRGCTACGFGHGPGDGRYRLEQLELIVLEGVTDDPAELFF